jgi:hypothetical protein
MHKLKVVLQNGHIILNSARATHHLITDDIILYLPNIIKDVGCECEELAEAIDHLVLIEIICSIAAHEINNNHHLCEGKSECPINKILRKVGLNYELEIPCEKDSTKPQDMVFGEGDGISRLLC